MNYQTRTTALILISVFLHAFAFFGGAYYLPVYFQVLGSSATGAGVRSVIHLSNFKKKCLTLPPRMLPFSLSGALMSVVSGQIISRWGRWRPIMWVSWVIMIVGFGIMTTLDDHSNVYVFCVDTYLGAITDSSELVRRGFCSRSLLRSALAACSR